MSKTKIGLALLLSVFILVASATTLLYLNDQETLIDKACFAIDSHDLELAANYMEKVKFINLYGDRRETLLMSACKNGNKECILYLLNRGANPNRTVSARLTPLELYCEYGYEAGDALLSLLLECGADQSKYSEQPALYQLANQFHWMNDEQKEIAAKEAVILLEYGAPLEYDGSTILHYAARGNMADLFNILIHTQQGLSLINVKNNDGLTAWNVAVENGAVGVQRVIRNLEAELKQKAEEQAQEELQAQIEQEQALETEEIVESTAEPTTEPTPTPVPKGYYSELYGD